ncbi:MAG TPA: T9SS type A sorting domain-containing protein [Bacteroidia bacterium]|nr:T9SS type A sorting domain-containing protein [Bacteroidia bacterium]
MKKILLLSLLCITLYSAPAQLAYTIDSTSFSALTLDGGVVEIEFADINQDHHPDIISIGDHGSPFINTNQHGITVFFGNGTNTGWSLYQTGDFGYGGIAAGDLNNDQLMDVAYGMHHDYSSTDFGDQLIEAALGNGTGMNWTPWDDSLATNGETYGMFGTEVGDVDNDGWLDISSNSFGCCAGVHVYKNLGTGAWEQTFGFVGGNTSHYMQFGDLNHDGNLDFAVCNQYGAPYFGDGAGNFVLKHNNLPPVGNYSYIDVSTGDIDNDGDDDFAFIAGGVPYIYKWNDAAQQWINSSTGLSGTSMYCSRLADLDVDGNMDLVTIGGLGLQIWKGNGGVSWINLLTYPLPGLTIGRDLTIADADHNGYPDILTMADYSTGLFSHINKLKLFKENSTASALNITSLFPKGYECFPNNAVRFIQWVCAVPGNHNSTVRIELSTAGAAGPWTLIEAAAPNNGKYQWTVPSAVSSSDCFLRLIAIDSVTMITDTSLNANKFQIGICNPTLDVAENSVLQDELVVAPNPFHTSAILFSSLKNCSLMMTDITGKAVQPVVKVKQFPFTVSCNNLAPGVYLLHVQKEDGTFSRMKLMVD